MNREIKFRGKRIDNGEWIYGYLCFIYIDADKARIYSPELVSSYDVLLESVGQYIELNDNNKNEIYEGDVYVDKNDCKYFIKIGEYKREIFQGSMNEISYGAYLLYENGEIDPNLKLLKTLKYLDNICDNPELLENQPSICS